MITDIIISLINLFDGFVGGSNAFNDLISRSSSFFTSLVTAFDNIKLAFSYLYFFIPRAYFEPLITIFLLVMLVKCITAVINLIYP